MELYHIFKALHLVAMVTWFAGLFYMFRLFVYHVENSSNPEIHSLLSIMEKKLYYYITWPGMLATLAFGICLVVTLDISFLEPWLLIKLALILTLVFYHLYIGYVRKRFLQNNFFLSSKQCRVRNEVPTLFLILIVFTAVCRFII